MSRIVIDVDENTEDIKLASNFVDKNIMVSALTASLIETLRRNGFSAESIKYYFDGLSKKVIKEGTT